MPAIFLAFCVARPAGDDLFAATITAHFYVVLFCELFDGHSTSLLRCFWVQPERAPQSVRLGERTQYRNGDAEHSSGILPCKTWWGLKEGAGILVSARGPPPYFLEPEPVNSCKKVPRL